MIIFLYGDDTYQSRQKLNEIIEHYKKIHKSGLNLRYFDGESLNFRDFKSEIETVSLFREKKLIVLKNIFANKGFQEEFLKDGERFVNSENIILIYEREKINKKNAFFKFLKENSKSQEFKPLEGQRLKGWIKREFEKYQAKIEPKAIDKLIDFVGNNLWQMENEIEKLVSYKLKSRNVEVLSKDIELLVKPKIEAAIFKTIDALAEKKKNLALNLIHRHLEKGDTPLYLLAMINFQLRNLLTLKELVEKNTPYYKIINKSNLHPFIVKKSLQQAKKFTFHQLKKIYRKIFEIDLAIKTGRLESKTALDILIAEI